MFQGQIDTISNKADWIGPFCEIVLDDGTIVNILNSDVGFDCVVTISRLNRPYSGIDFGDYYDCWTGSPLVVGSIANGKVIASLGDDGSGFQWAFTSADLSALRPGTYRFGVKTTTNGQIMDLIDGTLTVVEGNPNG